MDHSKSITNITSTTARSDAYITQLALNDFVESESVKYAPIDGVFCGTDYSHKFDAKTKTITIIADKKKIDLTVGEFIGYLNGYEITLEKAVIEKEGNVYVPLSFFNDILGLKITVDKTTVTFSKIQNQGLIKTDKLVYFNELLMEASKQSIKNGEEAYVRAFQKIKASADQFITEPIDSVIHKILVPPSGNKHDYMSTAPYFWPDESKPDGLPWVPHDGRINPASRNENTDFVRTSTMFEGIGELCISYYFSNDTKYLAHALKVIDAWFINQDTRMNPSIKYGQSVPGGVDGRCLGVIEWTAVVNVVTAVQMLVKNDMMTEAQLEAVVDWFIAYVSWLRRSELGIEECNQHNNHGSVYDYQVAGILLFLNNDTTADEIFETAKKKRIGYYFQPDGSQPYELRRTKSVNYHNTDVWPLTQVAELAMRFSTIDLWNYESPKGASLKKAYEFLLPYASGKKEWKWEQIDDSVEIKMAKIIRPLLLKVSKIFDYNIGDISNQAIAASASDTLRYQISGNQKNLLSATYLVNETPQTSIIRINWMFFNTDVVKYILYRKATTDATFTKITELTSEKNYFDKTALDYGKTYTYKLEAIDATGHVIESAESNAVVFKSKWIELKEALLTAEEGTTKEIDLFLVEKVPAFIFHAIKGRDIKLKFNTATKIEGNPIYWIVNGLDINKEVTTDSIFDVLPQFSLGVSASGRVNLPTDGDAYIEFGMVSLIGFVFPAKLFINIGINYASNKARLFYFGRQGVLEVVSDFVVSEDGSLVAYDLVVSEDGSLSFTINGAPDYTLVLYKGC